MVKEKNSKKEKLLKPDTLKLTTERDIAMDFAVKVYKKFSEMIKSVILFGSSAKKVSNSDSDIDIIIIIDDVSVKWDQELVVWYRENLGKTIEANPYKKSLHINTVKLSTWWHDLMRGDPIIINILRYGDTLMDTGGFFQPLQILLKEGKIKSTPESIYTLLQRAPTHLSRTRGSLLAAMDGLYWAMVDSAHAALIAAKVSPPSPEHIADILVEHFVKAKLMKSNYSEDFREMHLIAKDIVHGKKVQITGKEIDEWFGKTEDFVRKMAEIVDKLIED